MLPGMCNVSGAIASAVSLPIIIDWFSEYNNNIPIDMRPGYTKARITVIGPGGNSGRYTYGNSQGTTDYSGSSGSGGSLSSSVVTISPADVFRAIFAAANYATLQVGGTDLVRAGVGGNGTLVGDLLRYPGGGSSYYNTDGGHEYRAGGGAAGTYGNGGSGTAGSCDVWTRVSDGATATAGGTDANYGGGASTYGSPGQGLVVIEWGQTKPYV